MQFRRPLLAAITSVVLTAPLAVAAAHATEEPAPPGLPVVTADGLARPAGAPDRPVVAEALRDAEGTVTAFVELDAPSAVDTVTEGGDAEDVAAAADHVAALAEDVVPADAGARVAEGTPTTVAVTSNVVAGVVVTGDAEQVRALADEPSVTAVHLVVPKEIENKGTDVFTRALQTWTSTGLTGEGVTIGVIDTGIDYTHAAFGGPGTPEAYAQAYGTDGGGDIPEGLHDPAKVLGGYDFAGPTYDASGTVPGTSTVPQPDANPIDAPHDAGGGHGTHVAGTAAGYGVGPDGTTFRGDHTTLDADLADWQVGPGSAPLAGVYALKVFGDTGGSTALVIPALEWAADPNGDGDLSDRLDVVNMSLGSNFSTADDPENLFVDRLAEIGTLTVTSAGNAGDVTDVGGSPGNARTALTVANSVGLTQTYDAVDVVEAPDPSVEGRYPGQNSVNYTGDADVTAPVVHLGDQVDGCAPLTEHADAIAGNIVWLWWDDDDATRACGSTVRWDHATEVGAVGVLIGTELPVFTAGIAGNEEIPGAQLTAEATDALEPAIRAGGVVAHIGPSLASEAFVSDPGVADTLNTGSSRGVHGSLGIVKPDVAAPGTLISSAASGTGDDRVTYTGTSMSSPHVAGIAALVAQAQPDWTPGEVKAAVMNTAVHDVRDTAGVVFGPVRVGAGRVDALGAATTDVLAYAAEDPALVSVTYGVVPVGAEPVVLERTVTLRSTGESDRTFTTSFAQATSAGAASITVEPAEVTVPAGGTADVTVTLTVDPATLERELAPTMQSSYDLGIEVPREYVASISGRLVLTDGDRELRVPVQAAPRLVSDLRTQPVAFGAEELAAPLAVEGRGVASGGWLSITAPLVLAGTSPELEASDAVVTSPSAIRSGDLHHVGWASTAPQLAAAGGDPTAGTLAVGLSTYGEWASLGAAVIPVIDIDVDGDGIIDFEAQVSKLSPAHDVTVVETYALEYSPETGYALGDLVDLVPVNGLWADLDTTAFDNDVLVAPLNLAVLGVEPGQTPVVQVATFSPYSTSPDLLVDVLEPFTVDPFAPPVWFSAEGAQESVWFVGQPGTDVTVHRDPATAEAELLVLHTRNPAGERAQVVPVSVAEPPPVLDASRVDAAAPRTTLAGLPLPVVAVVTSEGAAPTGVVEVREGDRVLTTARVAAIGSRGVAVALVRGLAPGTHRLTVSYTGSDEVAPSTDEITVRVVSLRWR